MELPPRFRSVHLRWGRYVSEGIFVGSNDKSQYPSVKLTASLGPPSACLFSGANMLLVFVGVYIPVAKCLNLKYHRARDNVYDGLRDERKCICLEKPAARTCRTCWFLCQVAFQDVKVFMFVLCTLEIQHILAWISQIAIFERKLPFQITLF